MRQRDGEPLREHGGHLQRQVPRRQQILRRIRRLLSSAVALRPEDPRRHSIRGSGAHALRRHHRLCALEEERLWAGQESRHRRGRRLRPLWHPVRQGWSLVPSKPEAEAKLY